MSGLLPKLAVHDHRRLDFLIVVTAMNFAPVIDELIADDHAVRMEERESRAFFMQAENIQLLAEFTMVTLGSFLEHMQIFFQIRLLFKSRTIDALQHLVLFTAAPVSACNALQFDCLDLARAQHMRACAEIREFTLCIEGNHCILRQIIDELYLVVLTLFGKEL